MGLNMFSKGSFVCLLAISFYLGKYKYNVKYKFVC